MRTTAGGMSSVPGWIKTIAGGSGKKGCSKKFKERAQAIFPVVATIVFWVSISTPFFFRAGDDVQVVAPEEVIRFHVKAHSNDPLEQDLKNYVAAKIIDLYTPLWSTLHTREELSCFLSKNCADLENTAGRLIKEKGFEREVKVFLKHNPFPVRYYQGRLFPPGEYETLYVIIGDGRGENWWCVLFPPLCFHVFPGVEEKEAQQQTEAKITSGAEPGGGNGCISSLDKDKEELPLKKPKWRSWLLEIWRARR